MNHYPPRQSILLPVCLAVCCCLLVGCAEVAPPPGGAIDKTAPQLVSTTPVNGSVNVADGNRVELVFSERIVRPSTGRTVFISPRPQEEPDINWKADRIEIKLDEGFAADQTYLISVASSVADLRGNRLDSTITIAFSTGEILDSGKVSGRVVQSNGNGARNTYVALYDSTALADSVVYDSLYPAYVTLTNDQGEFSLQYLPSEEYRLIAYSDKNRDELFNPRREQFAVPDRPIIVGGETDLSELMLPLTQMDTTRPAILSATVNENNLVRLRLSKNIPSTLLAVQPANARLISLADTLHFVVAEGFAESHLDESDVLQMYFDNPEPGVYRIEVTYDATMPALIQDSFEVSEREDEMPPEIVEFTPPNRPQFVRDIDITLVLSEPLVQDSINSETFLLVQDSVTPLPVAFQWRDPFHLQFRTQLTSGSDYRLDIAEFDLVDLAGNPLGDSLAQYEFTTLDNDSLGSISGEAVVLIAGRLNDEVVLTFDLVGSAQQFELPVAGNKFKIDVPAGKYVLSGFVDSNGNRERDDGSVQPFELSETRAVYPDTIAVRARFETAGIKFIFR